MPQAVGTRVLNRDQDPSHWLPAVPVLPAIDREVLRRWETGQVLQRSFAQSAGGPQWICYEEPPTANGMPGAHHVPALATVDLYRRFKTMQGFRVSRRVGWNCHGLPVEVAVERELALSGPAEIEAYGVERFNARCRESALRHTEAFTSLTTRLGCWADPDGRLHSMDAGYVEWIWASLRRLFDAGLLVREHRIVSYCPRCQTPVSHADASQPGVRQSAVSQSVTVRVRLATLPEGASRWLRDAELLVWTTTPWTLVASAAIAVHPHQRYAIARRPGHDEKVVVAQSLAPAVLGEGWHITARVTGTELAGATYEPIFDLTGEPGAGRVISGYFVRADTGTGIVGVAPALGTADLAAGHAHGLGVISVIGPDGCFDRDLALVGGVFCTDADPILITNLTDRGLLFSARRHQRSVPHCWRCGTVLLDYAWPAWYIRTSAIAQELLADTTRIRWEPAGSGTAGRTDSGDWALSRSRYWGTPLPLWECGHGHLTCAGSLAELSALAGRDLTGLDPHRPQIDLVLITCPQCGAQARRVTEVIDGSYDAGAMPFTLHGEAQDLPAQLVVSAADPATGWLQRLTAMSRLLFDRPAAQTVLRLGALADESGRPMSQSQGNVAEPLPLIERFGADAVRWLLTVASPRSAPGKVTPAALADVVRKPLLTYWNVVAFFVRHANVASAQDGSWRPDSQAAPPPASRPLLDRWLLSELHALIGDLTADLDEFRLEAAGRRIARFVQDLSTWYLRRSRRRFADAVMASPRTAGTSGTSGMAGMAGALPSESAAAFATLHECLDVLTRLMAPVTPFLADYVWQVIRAPDAPDSVHLATWPVATPALVDDLLARQMALARRLAWLGRSARASAGIRLRWPLARALVIAEDPAHVRLPAELAGQIADELNVRTLDYLPAGREEETGFTLRPGYRALGRRFGSETPAIAAADPAAVAAHEVITTRRPPAGWAASVDGGLAVALDPAITPELRREGIARDVIRLVQDARRAAGLQSGDRIELRWSASDRDVARALAEHGLMISGRVRAAEYGPASAPAYPRTGTTIAEHTVAGLGLAFWLRQLEPQARPGSS